MLRIMIVDDEEFLHELYGRLLKLKGHTVAASVFNGEEAVSTYRSLNSRPDVVLMDHRMPVMNGLEAMKEILAIEPSALVVFLTADSSVAEQAIEMGATDVLLKPFRMDVLHQTMDALAQRLDDA
jgi:two-component system chemotaxis response regulator CheY